MCRRGASRSGSSRRRARRAAQPLVRLPGESDTYCTNIDCPAQRVQRIAHYASRSAMDIEGLGEERVLQLVGGRSDQRRGRPLRPHGRAARRRSSASARCRRPTWWPAIEASRTQPLSRLLVALGIRHVGPDGRPGGGPRLRIARGDRGGAGRGAGRGRRRRRRHRGEPGRVPGGGDQRGRCVDRLRAAGVTMEEPGAAGTSGGGAGAAAALPQTLDGKTVVVTGRGARDTPGRGPKRRSWRGAASRPGACRRRPSCSWWATRRAPARSKKAEELGIPTVDAAAFRRSLETGELPGVRTTGAGGGVSTGRAPAGSVA